MRTVSGIPMVGTVGNKGLKAHRYETDTSVSVSFCICANWFFSFEVIHAPSLLMVLTSSSKARLAGRSSLLSSSSTREGLRMRAGARLF